MAFDKSDLETCSNFVAHAELAWLAQVFGVSGLCLGDFLSRSAGSAVQTGLRTGHSRKDTSDCIGNCGRRNVDAAASMELSVLIGANALMALMCWPSWSSWPS